jgi:hypothetical protein
VKYEVMAAVKVICFHLRLRHGGMERLKSEEVTGSPINTRLSILVVNASRL